MTSTNSLTTTNKETAPPVCTVCRKHKAQLRPRKSKLINAMSMWLCNDCFDGKREPRFAVILYARKNGVESVRPYIRGHRYEGDKITLDELM
jgi:hypothetical protein